MKVIKVGVIDSGINPSAIRGNVICQMGDNKDFIGHGTMCSYLIEKYSNTPIEFYSYKIFEKNLKTNLNTFLQALEKAAEDELDILNLSLSVRENTCASISDIIEELVKNNVKIVAAKSSGNIQSIFDKSKDVSSVVGGCYFDSYIFRRNEQYIIDDGEPVLAKWYDLEYDFLGGNSKAAAIYSAKLCHMIQGDSVIQKIPEINPKYEIKNELTMDEITILTSISKYSKVNMNDMISENDWKKFGDAFNDILVKYLIDKFGCNVLDKITIFYESFKNFSSFLALVEELDTCMN